MLYLAFFIVATIITALYLLVTKLRISFILRVNISEAGFDAEVRVMFYKLLTLYRWNLKEGGLTFLLKKKKNVPDELKEKKGRLGASLNMLFSKDTFEHLRHDMEIFDVSVKGRLATDNAALTAMIYGGVWEIIGILIPFIPQKHLFLDFYPDFKKETPDFHVSCILRVRIIHIIVLIVQQKRNDRKGRSESYGTASY